MSRLIRNSSHKLRIYLNKGRMSTKDGKLIKYISNDGGMT